MNTHSILGKGLAACAGFFLLSSATALAQIQAGLLNYWPLDGDATDVAPEVDGASGTTRDDGMINGAVTFSDATTEGLGTGFGQVGNFPGGGGNNITVADPSAGTDDIDRSGADLSISVWIKANAWNTGWQAIIAHGEQSDYRVARRGGNNPVLLSYAGGVGDIQTTTSYGNAPDGDGNWHHIVAISGNGVSTQLYVNGVLEATGGAPTISPSNANNNVLCIGCNPDNGREFNGFIDDVAMWDRVLTADEVTSIYNAGQAGQSLASLFPVPGDDDNDGLPNAWEERYGLDPNDDGTTDVNNGPDGDPDNDNVSNLDEFNNNTLPNDEDSDNDNLNDGVETNTGNFVSTDDTGTNPLNNDSDGDGLLDGVEDNGGTFVDENQTGSNPNVADTDTDTMPDGYEVTNIQDPNVNDGDADPDSDTLSNLVEFGLGTDPQDDDSDDDLSKDGDEQTNGTDPLDSDSDNDTLLDGYETNDGNFVGPEETGTDPLTTDFDNDGTHDGAEVLGSRDPTDPSDAVSSGLGQKLVAYWNFDNNLDDIAHTLPGESMVADTGEFTGPETDVFYAAEGLYGSSALEQATGGAGWVTVPSSVDTLRGIDNSVSVSAWVKVASFDSNWQAIISHGEGRQWRLARNNGSGGVAWSGGVPDIGGGDVSDGLWHHVVGVSDPVNFTSAIYVDGVQVNTGEAPAITDVNGGIIPDLFIGANPQGPNREWMGQIDDLAIWGRGLTQDEVTEIFEAGVSLEDLLGGGTGLTITDTSFDPSVGENGQFSITFSSRAGANYGLFYSTDLFDFSADVNDSITGQDGSTTFTFPHPEPGVSRIFFRVEQN